MVTGIDGFIDSNSVKKLFDMDRDIRVISIDNLNVYYDVNLKEYCLKNLENYPGFQFVIGNIADKELVVMQ